MSKVGWGVYCQSRHSIIRFSSRTLSNHTATLSKSVGCRWAVLISLLGASTASVALWQNRGSLLFLTEKNSASCSGKTENQTGDKGVQKEEEDNGSEDMAERKMSRREIRFNDFASWEYHGQAVMTPQDFLESLVENSPKFTRRGKVALTEQDVQRILNRTPSISKGSPRLFRNLHHEGIITYSEYLFLVTILTKSHTGLKIALKMMDIDGDHMINNFEFQEVQKMINKKAATTVKGGSGVPDLKTSVMVHLFGFKGKGQVTFDQFFGFMNNLQSEVLELEFHEFAKSMNSITELDFARILMRNTVLSSDDHRDYLNRLSERLQVSKGITLQQFKDFNKFLNNIDDFVIAMRMYGAVQEPVAQDAFQRAVKMSTGVDIDNHVTNVLFKLFDIDGDGKLSHVELVGIMKDRLKRGFGKYPKLKGMKGFKHCLHKEMHS